MKAPASDLGQQCAEKIECARKQPLHKRRIIEKIKQIHEASHQVYGAVRITVKLRENGDKVNEKTVGNDMREDHLKACYISPYTRTACSKDFSDRSISILKQEFNPGRYQLVCQPKR